MTTRYKIVPSQWPLWTSTVCPQVTVQYNWSFLVHTYPSVLCYTLNCFYVSGVHISWPHRCHADVVLLKELVPEGWTIWRGRQGESSHKTCSQIFLMLCWFFFSGSQSPSISLFSVGFHNLPMLILNIYNISWVSDFWFRAPTSDFFLWWGLMLCPLSVVYWLLEKQLTNGLTHTNRLKISISINKHYLGLYFSGIFCE